MRRLILFLLVIYLFPVSIHAASQIQIFEVKGPTVIAFFGPVTNDKLDKDADLNESLSDFQYHLQGAKPRLEAAGIKVHEIYAKSFTVKLADSTTTFKPKNAGVGYYFIMPGKKPKIQYGVTTDIDVLYIASDYFGKKII
jgi:hypothetical protein